MARRQGFEPGPVHVGFVADKVSLGRSFRRVRIVAKSAYQLRHVRQSVPRYQCLIVAGDKFAPRALVCNTKYFYTVDGDVQLNNTQKNALLRFQWDEGYENAPQPYVLRT